MAGRRPTPTALKLVTGNPGRRPLNSAEPTPPPYSAQPPTHLSNTAKDTWERLTQLLNSMSVLTLADAFALERLCDIYDEILRYRAMIQRKGETFEVHSQNGVLIKANPAVSMLSDADKRFKSYLVEFGLTPAARTKVRTHDKATHPDELDEFFSP
ncbi:phage terminase small subunit P27 family [Candidatus Williamhamiltonella defendens]|uniref:phage terminase small subunit P27 family n=1 Tax=Candidatus Williamhamiltonella defendens TaxID=138072 RepID=UPI000D5FF2E6|nr:phage terminase small subunit P27 family [Candidatus Hamiltonella defensa]AWK16076.1 terminase [Candidatus Hamiltonella defensa]